jgi:AraC-like DNA-binding protein
MPANSPTEVFENALSVSFLQAGFDNAIPDGRVDTKTVPYTIIVQPVSGWYTVLCGNKTISARSGDSVLIPANTEVTFVHHGFRKAPMRVRWVHVNWKLLSTIDITDLLHMPTRVTGEASTIFGETISELLGHSARPGGLNLAVLARRNELALKLLRVVIEQSRPREDMDEFLGRTRRFQQVFEHINAHYAESLTVEKLAAVACLSPSRFFVSFRESVHISPMQYLRNVRLSNACKLLLSTGNSISRVAADAGFINQFHFSRVFKESTGMSPTEYRKGNF